MSTHPRLKALLESQEKFPCEFIVKFIGKNSHPFRQGAHELETRHAPLLKLQSARESSSANNLALTYVFDAKSADAIIALLDEVSRIPEVLIIL